MLLRAPRWSLGGYACEGIGLPAHSIATRFINFTIKIARQHLHIVVVFAGRRALWLSGVYNN